MQTLVDLSTKDLLVLEITYFSSVFLILTITLIFEPINCTLALAIVSFLYTSLNALLVHVGLNMILIYLVSNCNHIFDSVHDVSVMKVVRLVNLISTSGLSYLGLFYLGNIRNEKLYHLLIGTWTSEVFKPYSIMILGVVDLAIFLVFQYKMESAHSHPGDKKKDKEEYSIVTLRAISLVIILGFVGIVTVVSLKIFQLEHAPSWPFVIHILAIFIMVFVNNTMWILKSPKIFDYAKLQLYRFADKIRF